MRLNKDILSKMNNPFDPIEYFNLLKYDVVKYTDTNMIIKKDGKKTRVEIARTYEPMWLEQYLDLIDNECIVVVIMSKLGIYEVCTNKEFRTKYLHDLPETNKKKNK